MCQLTEGASRRAGFSFVSQSQYVAILIEYSIQCIKMIHDKNYDMTKILDISNYKITGTEVKETHR